jgi:RNA-directed DNA polymerase
MNHVLSTTRQADLQRSDGPIYFTRADTHCWQYTWVQKRSLSHRPSKKKIKSVIDKIHELTDAKTTWQDAEQLVVKINRVVRGWSNYFNVGWNSKAYRAVDTYTAARLRRWLCKKHKVRRAGFVAYPPEYLHETLGLVHLNRAKHRRSCAKR